MNYPYRYQYKAIAASSTATPCAVTTGATGDYLHQIIVSNVTVATATLTLIDGANSIVLQTGSATLPNSTFTLPINAVSNNGPWKITTGAGVTVVVVGVFAA
jgi:hypothetical protein